MELLLAVGITLCAVAILILCSYNNQLHHRVESYKVLHGAALSEAREWECKYWAEHTSTDIPPAPPSHGVEDVDVESVMAGSDDPVWELVIACRSTGIMGEWLRNNPPVQAQQKHRQYGEFATWILQLPEEKQTIQGVTYAVRHHE